MLVLPQTVLIRWNRNPKQREYYIDKGYIFTNCSDSFECNVLDLSISSQKKVWVQCDYCDKKVQKTYADYLKTKKQNINKDCCSNCQPLKYKESNLEKYGVENSFQREEIKEKIKATNLELFGVEYISQSIEIKQKTIETNRRNLGVDYPTQSSEVLRKRDENNLKNYGVINTAQLPEVQEKMRNTNLLKYGVDHYSKTDEYKERYKNTSLIRYGVDSPIKHPSIREKQLNTMYKNKTFTCSQQQEYIHQIINGELNYPISKFVADIAFPDEKIYLEYDGGGHDLSVELGTYTKEEFDQREIVRSKIIKRLGWKEIRIISKKDKLPKIEVLKQIIQHAKNHFSSNHSWIRFDIDQGVVSSSLGTSPFYFGQLYLVKQINSLIKEENA